MELMDKYYLDHPTAGVLTMVNMLSLLGIVANPKRVRRLLRKMNIHAIYPQKCLSGGGCAKYVHPYLLRGPRDNEAKSGVEHRHQLYTDEGWIHVPLCHHRCLQPLHRGLEAK